MNEQSSIPVEAQAVPDQHQQYVYVRLIRPEGYEDVHPELLVADAHIHPAFEPELVAASPAAAAGVPTEASLDNFDSAVAILNDFESAVQALSGELWKQEWQDAYDAAKTALISALTRPTPAAGVPTGWKLPEGCKVESSFHHIGNCMVEPTVTVTLPAINSEDGDHRMWTERDRIAALLASSPVAPVGAPTRRLTAYLRTQLYGYGVPREAIEEAVAEVSRILSAQGCELATDATKQLREHSVHLPESDA